MDTGPEVIEPHHPNLPLSQHTWVQILFDIFPNTFRIRFSLPGAPDGRGFCILEPFDWSVKARPPQSSEYIVFKIVFEPRSVNTKNV